MASRLQVRSLQYAFKGKAAGLTFDELRSALPLCSRRERAPKHVRSLVSTAIALGVLRVEQGGDGQVRYLAAESLFGISMESRKPICPSCHGFAKDERHGCFICECGKVVRKEPVAFLCERCGKLGYGYRWSSGTLETIDICDVRDNDGRSQCCLPRALLASPPRSPKTTARYSTMAQTLTCPHGGNQWGDHGSHIRDCRPNAEGLVVCSHTSCRLPFYLPEGYFACPGCGNPGGHLITPSNEGVCAVCNGCQLPFPVPRRWALCECGHQQGIPEDAPKMRNSEGWYQYVTCACGRRLFAPA